MRSIVLVLFCLVALQCFAQQSRKDSLRRDSLMRVGFYQCEAILKMDFDTCIRSYDSLCGSACPEWICMDTVTHDSIAGGAVYQSCCSYKSERIYKNGKYIGSIIEESGPRRKNEAVYFVGGTMITVTWKGEYALDNLQMVENIFPICAPLPRDAGPIRQ